MSDSDRQRWDEKYALQSPPEELLPDDWLIENVENRQPGRALELACGVGHNAIRLAQQGWTVDAVDISAAGLRLAAQLAARFSCPPLQWIAAEIDEFTPEPETYDLILVFRFLDRRRLPAVISAALRPGGRLIYETFSRSQLDRSDNHIRNPAFTLEPGELPRLYGGLEIIADRETEFPDRTVVQFVGEKFSNA